MPVTASAPVVSVLVPTYRRPHHLPLTLSALARQDLAESWELVVVDNDPTGSARVQVEQARATFPVRVRYVVEPRRGAAAARNRGIAEALGEIVAMLDDDVLPRPDWLRQLVGPLLDGAADGSGGRVLLDPSVRRPWWFGQDLVGGLLSHFDPTERARALVGDEFVVTANAAFRLEALRRTMGFDPALGPNGDRHMVNDDLQVARDLQRLGARLVYAPAAVVQHELPAERLKVRWLLRRAWWQGRSDWVLHEQDYRRRRLFGARIAVAHLPPTLTSRVRSTRFGGPLLVRLACDLAVTGGAIAEAISWRSKDFERSWQWRPRELAPAVTVVLPTFRRPASLARLLASLAVQQVDLPWELVVIDNDPVAGALPVVQAAAAGFVVPIRYVTEHRLGAAHARNRGIAEARGAITVMVDDDVEVAAGWLAELVAPLLDGVADVAGGQVVLDPRVARPRWFSDALIGGYLTRLDLGPVLRPLAIDEIVLTANAAFRTDLLRAAAGFDVRLGPSGRRQIVHDDTQVLRAAQALGGRAVFVPAAVVVHELPAARLRPSWILRRAFWQGRSDWLLDRGVYEGRRGNGARVAVAYWSTHTRGDLAKTDAAQGQRAFAALCSTVRLAGALVEAASWGPRRPGRDGVGA